MILCIRFLYRFRTHYNTIILTFDFFLLSKGFQNVNLIFYEKIKSNTPALSGQNLEHSVNPGGRGPIFQGIEHSWFLTDYPS